MATEFTDLGFFSIKEALKNYLKQQDKFKDYDFAGSNLNVVLDVLAYNTYQNNLYANMALNESFLDTAQLKNSVISHAKSLNYLPNSRTSARAIVDITISTTSPTSFTIIPRNTALRARYQNMSYTFYTKETVSASKVNNIFSFRSVEIVEGRLIKDAFEVTANSRYIIPNTDIDVDTLRVSVTTNAETDDYILKRDIFGVKASDKVFYIQPAFDDKYEITFGNNMFGVSPQIGSIINIEYLNSSGELANGCFLFNTDSIGSFANPTVSTVVVASGGGEREDVESIRYFAPKSIQIQDRAVTETDYEILLLNNFSEIKTVAVYGGDLASPPQYGRVIASISLKDNKTITLADIDRYNNFLKDRTPLSIEPIITTPRYMNLNINANIKYNIAKSTKNASEIKQSVFDVIKAYSNHDLNKFKADFYYSKFLALIDHADDNIISNDTSVSVSINITPTRNIGLTTSLNFSNRIESISSSSFIYNNTVAYIKDDGNGVLNILSYNSSNVLVLKYNVGTVDYINGIISLSNFIAQDYTNSIKIIVNTTSKDIKPPVGTILLIEDQDIKINVS